MTPIRVTLGGAGRVGRDVARLIEQRAGAELVAAYSRNPELVGTELAGVSVVLERERALEVPSEVVVVATSSFLRDVADDLRAAAESGRNVICTAEEAAYPWANDPQLAGELAGLAVDRGVTILGTGINPGFVFDALVLTATGAAWDVERIRVERVVNLSGFSETVLKRIGVGHTPQEFAQGTRSGAITGHIGFPQSMRLVGQALGRALDSVERELTPLVAERRFAGERLEVPPGRTAGFEQRYVGSSAGQAWFEARLIGHLDPPAIGEALRDEIWIDGTPPLHFSIQPGLNAQSTVSAVIVNSLRRVVDAPPGWLTVAGLPPAIAGS